MAAEITERMGRAPTLRIFIDGWECIGITLGPVAPESREWLAEILDRAFTDAIEKAVRRARAKDQAAMRKLLGIG